MTESNLIKDEIMYIEAIPDNTGLNYLFDIFKKCKMNDVFPVIDSMNYPIGVIHEYDFKEYVYSPFGKDILKNRSVRRDLKSFVRDCPIVEIGESLDTILGNYGYMGNHVGVIVTENRHYVGFLTSSAILKIVNKRNLDIKQLESINMIAVTAGDQINTPLSVIIGRAAIIPMLMKTDNQEILKNLSIIKQQAYRIKKTVEAMKNIKTIKDKDYKLDDLKMLDLNIFLSNMSEIVN